VLTNRSSGKTGRAVAAACYARGADVTLVHGDGDVPYAEVRDVETAAEMTAATLDACEGADALVSAAAIGDYTVVDPRDEKIRSGQELTLSLEPTPKLLDAVRDDHPDLPVVGFKAETSGGDDDAMVEAARGILDRSGLSFVVANDAGVMGDEDTRALFVTADAADEYVGDKRGLGERVADELADRL
jgi:phosphopantothenoylcysteine decarboxylase/phosphopantothenate--cysteine ligase